MKARGALVLLSYLWCITLGNFAHTFSHHLDEKHHAHSIACLKTVFHEVPGDSQTPASRTTLTQIDCPIKSLLHEITSRGIEKTPQFVVELPSLSPPPVLNRPLVVFQRKVFSLTLSPRGPPA